MATNVLTINEEMVEQNASLFGSNRLRYNMYSNFMVGAEKNYSNGKLQNAKHKSITWDVLQKFPEDKLAQVLKSSSTEFAQAQAISKEFKYKQMPFCVEFTLSNLDNVSTTNINAGILNNLLKQYDEVTYKGGIGNQGLENNQNIITLDAMPATDISEMLAATSTAFNEMKQIGIRQSDFSNVAIGYTSGVAQLLTNINITQSMTNHKVFNDAFTASPKDEIPTILSGSNEYIEIYYRPMVTLHHGASPSLYSTEMGKHGLDLFSLFAFESTAIEIEEKGAVVRVPVTLS
jgi:hypothetical protein